jgi:signal transduction histidine kinase
MGTISLLATLLSTAPDVGPDSRARAVLILKEIRWLDQLQRAYEESLLAPADAGGRAPREKTRLDLVAAEVVETIRLSHTTLIEFRAEELTVFTDPLAFWRVLRNVVENAVRAAGPSGTVRVRISVEGGGAVTHVEDDGPGFSTAPPRPDSLGLEIVQDLASGWGGGLEIRRSRLGGGSVRLRIPIAPPTGQQRVDGRLP